MLLPQSSRPNGDQELYLDNHGNYSRFLPFLAPTQFLSFLYRTVLNPGGQRLKSEGKVLEVIYLLVKVPASHKEVSFGGE